MSVCFLIIRIVLIKAVIAVFLQLTDSFMPSGALSAHIVALY
ncbi:hypothetical protein AALB_3202 [Agarivorans albus MKT 106]|uniref:Uncharacterized protein n=1 Tax=Agarivorans albus MKT 106 TaxID=1331007 RepID=R9PP00_AGAAL|nr:hypothetical protein AALB_3202 [Agarivorans albus MKT 106]